MDPISAISSNLAASGTSRLLAEAFVKMQQTLARLSSGKRINSPEVDAAGLAQLERLTSQAGQIDAGSSNVANATSLTEVQSATAQQLADLEARKGELAIRAQDATLTDSDRQAIQAEFAALQGSQNQLLGQQFNGVPVFSSSSQQVVTDGDGSNVTLSAINLGGSVASGGIAESTSGATSVSTSANAASALNTINSSLNNITRGLANVGAGQARLTVTAETNDIRVENLNAAASRIGDTDFAQESANLSRFSVGVQAGIRSLRQANSLGSLGLNVLA
jgi:flagellin